MKKPTDVEVDDIPLTIAGKHGLNLEMDYNIKAAIPRERLDNNALTSATGESMMLFSSRHNNWVLTLREVKRLIC